jgi:hypothetical protein
VKSAGGVLEIRRQPVDFPVAVARRFGTVAAGNFLRAIDRMPVPLGAACRRLRQGALRSRRERVLGGRAIVGLRKGCGFGRCVGSRHSSQLAQRELGCKRP